MIGALVAGITGSGGASLSSYESIATATGTGSSGTITFSSIPSTFKHLQIRGIARSDGATTTNTYLTLQFNGDTATNYAMHYLRGDGTTATALGVVTLASIQLRNGLIRNNGLASTMSVYVIDILDYAATTKNKTVRSFDGVEENNTNAQSVLEIASGLWLNTNAISSISVNSYSGNFTTATTFALYGIKEA